MTSPVDPEELHDHDQEVMDDSESDNDEEFQVDDLLVP